MPTLDDIVAELTQRDDCVFQPVTRLPTLPDGLRLPPDLAAFFARFSQAKLFESRYRILPPDEFVQIGFAIYGEPTRQSIQQSWFALADVQDGNFLAIDCSPKRLGYCYDAFHETIDLLDYCKVIARSFTELLHRASVAGDDAWWLNDRFETYGYADQFSD